MTTDVIALASLILQILLTVVGWMRIPGQQVNYRVFGLEVTRSKAETLLITPALTLMLVVVSLSRGGAPPSAVVDVVTAVVMILLAAVHYWTVLRAMK